MAPHEKDSKAPECSFNNARRKHRQKKGMTRVFLIGQDNAIMSLRTHSLISPFKKKYDLR